MNKHFFQGHRESAKKLIECQSFVMTRIRNAI